MQHPIPNHTSSMSWWNPPDHIAKKVIKHALRKIPGHQKLMDYCYPRQMKTSQLPPHKYDDGGRLQWSFG